MVVNIPFMKNGYAHPQCYLAETNGCSKKISKEHYISKSLLDQIEKQNAKIDIAGLTWIPREQYKSVGKASLTSKMLCQKHNSALSPIDGAICEFTRAISAIDADFLNEQPEGLVCNVDGRYVERWILKTLIGMVTSKQFKESLSYKNKCSKLLCSPTARWPKHWGLYVAPPSTTNYHSSSFELVPKYNPSNGCVLLIELGFKGLMMNFAMGKPGNPEMLGIFRPNRMMFQKGDCRSQIRFEWGGRKTGPDVIYTHVGTYKGHGPNFKFL